MKVQLICVNGRRPVRHRRWEFENEVLADWHGGWYFVHLFENQSAAYGGQTLLSGRRLHGRQRQRRHSVALFNFGNGAVVASSATCTVLTVL